MSYHFVEISGYDRATLFARDGQLVCHQGEAKRQVPLEDVGAILVTAPACSLSAHLIAQASAHRIPIVICENFKPTSLFLPLHRSTDTLITRAQIEAPKRFTEALWIKTLTAKCRHQCLLAEALAGESDRLAQMRLLAEQPLATKEGPCARLYWDVCSAALHIDAFERRPGDSDSLNGLLNYAYALLLSQTLQSLLLAGLDPLYGIGHATRERATPLAYDVMEPLRPLVDAWVFKWFEAHRGGDAPPSVEKPYKVFLRRCLAGEGDAGEGSLLENLVATSRGLRTAFSERSLKEYNPWQWRTLRWDGYLSALISR